MTDDLPWITLEQATDALARGTGRGIKIAILDSGVELDHPDLHGVRTCDDLAILDDGLSLQIAAGGRRDVFGHGTAVADIVHRLAPEAEIGSIRVLGEQLHSRTALIREGARQALDRGYHILNCAFGCGLPSHVLDYKNWVDEAYLKNVHVVAACNNFDWTKPEWPGHFSSVITVNMAQTPDAEALFYKSGSLVEFLARGVDVRTAWKEGQRKEVTGSSFAAAHLSGLLARLLSLAPELTPLQAKTILRRVAQPWPQNGSSASCSGAPSRACA